MNGVPPPCKASSRQCLLLPPLSILFASTGTSPISILLSPSLCCHFFHLKRNPLTSLPPPARFSAPPLCGRTAWNTLPSLPVSLGPNIISIKLPWPFYANLQAAHPDHPSYYSYFHSTYKSIILYNVLVFCSFTLLSTFPNRRAYALKAEILKRPVLFIDISQVPEQCLAQRRQ